MWGHPSSLVVVDYADQPDSKAATINCFGCEKTEDYADTLTLECTIWPKKFSCCGSIGVGSCVDDSRLLTCTDAENYLCPLPSTAPSMLPTPSPPPSFAPTPPPTVACSPGEFLVAAANVCVSCGIGTFSNVSTLPWPSSCALCSGGTYASQSSSTQCKACPVGKLSTEDRSGCSTCSAGQFTLNQTSCADCPTGFYAPQALTGACLSCGAGSHTAALKAATTCTPCNPGGYASAASANCSACESGRYSGSGASSCTSCAKGKKAEEKGASGCATCASGSFSSAGASSCALCAQGTSSSAGSAACSNCAEGFAASTKGSTQCVACDAGSYAPASAAVNCTLCPLGHAQGATGQDHCTACSPGTYSEEAGTTSCADCPGNAFSAKEASACTRCLKNYFYDDSCLPCPDGTQCDVDGNSTLADLVLLPGWWRISESTDEIRRCPHGSLACRGGLLFQDGYCKEGHQGVLCAVCINEFYFSPGDSKCLSCEDLPGLGALWLESPPLIAFSFLFVVFLGFVVKVACASDLSEMNKRMQQGKQVEKHVERITGLLGFARELMVHVKGGKVKLKALTSFFQIAQNVSVCGFPREHLFVYRKIFLVFCLPDNCWHSYYALFRVCVQFNCSVSFPDVFNVILAPLNILNLNIVPSLALACRINNFDYANTLVGITVSPIVFAAFLFLLYGIQVAVRKRKAEASKKVVEQLTAQYVVPEELLLFFTRDEIATFRQAFAFFDTDYSGIIDKQEMAQALLALGLTPSEDFLSTLFKKVSPLAMSEDNPELSFGEYLKALQRTRREGRETEFSLIIDIVEERSKQQQADSMFYVLLLFSFVILIGTSTTIFEYFQCRVFEETEPAVSYLVRDYSLNCESPRYKTFMVLAVAMLLVYPLG